MRFSIALTTLLAVIVTVCQNASAQEPEGRRLLKTNVVPTAHELANPDLYYPSVSERYVPPPPVWGAPPPLGSVRPGEFEPLDSTIISVVDASGDYGVMWRDMVDGLSDYGHVWIIANSVDQSNMDGMLMAAGVDPSAYSFLNYPVNTIWVRDFGPEFARAPDGERYIFDADYSHRPLDDVIPILMGGSDWINSDGSPMEVNTVDHMLSGGNIMSDGAGTCFFSHIVYGYEKPAGWSDEDVDDLMMEYLGCEQMVVLNPICNDPTGHIDLYAKLVGPTSMLLVEFPADTYFDGTKDAGVVGHCGTSTPDDRQDQEDNLATIQATTNLSGDDWVITRAPIPEPVQMWGEWGYRSYMNSEIMNGVVLMPTFYSPFSGETAGDLLDMEAAAIAAYEAAAPGITVIPIDVDHMNGTGGAIHCISHDIPEEAGGEWVAPAEYCGDGVRNGDEECDGEDFGGDTCAEYGSTDADVLRCNSDCTVDDSECPSNSCGDGVVDDDEECDPCSSDLPECSDMGLGSGQAGCDLDCTINWYNCEEATLCEVASAIDPKVLCCPQDVPATCADDAWPWPDGDPLYGCCSADLTIAYWCNDNTGAPGASDCAGGQHCQYIEGEDWDECGPGSVPEAAAPDIDCDVDTDTDTDTDTDSDTDADAGTGGGGGGDGCGCSAAGAPRASFLSLLLS